MSTIVDARKPEPGEVCTCGRPAIIVYLTEGFGPVGYCGIPGPRMRGRWGSADAGMDSGLAEYLPTADARALRRILSAYVEAGLIEHQPWDRSEALKAWADDLEARHQRAEGCQGRTRKGTKCKSKRWPYCCAAHRDQGLTRRSDGGQRGV